MMFQRLSLLVFLNGFTDTERSAVSVQSNSKSGQQGLSSTVRFSEVRPHELNGLKIVGELCTVLAQHLAP